MFPKKRLCGNKRKRSLIRILPIFSIVFCVSNKKKSDGKQLTPTQNLPEFGCGTLRNTILTLIKTYNAKKIKYQDMCDTKHNIGGSINYRTLNSSSKIAELKNALMH